MQLDNAKLKQLRESNAWSQSHLAEVSGVSMRTIQRIEKTGAVSPESAKCICAAFDIQFDELSVNDNYQKSEPSLADLLKFKVMDIDKKAALVSFIVAFIIAYGIAISMGVEI
ncbi:helix-turn-helix domain-containing protein [Gracilimonas sediminicola]|uniref:Helix-turn-helix domain-containing protein n=1 Tax=Gracilimonas sediminicola TaxID=2952158 RepID=A0A9X2L5I0_9BACT|nr:helix-turn-helix transcriptional regulator [Gracilimonas sediminicola]MCP9292729.1 helix-turn-helix domain-containing protein [Gracilimonas sediminicola]